MKNNYFFKKKFSNIYKNASEKSEVTSQILYGEEFNILSKSKKWIKIKSLFDNYTGYIENKDYLSKHNPKYKIHSLKANILYEIFFSLLILLFSQFFLLYLKLA